GTSVSLRRPRRRCRTGPAADAPIWNPARVLSWPFDRWAELASDRAGQPRVEADSLYRRAALGVLVQLARHAEENLSTEATDRLWNVEATFESVGRELSNDVPELGD